MDILFHDDTFWPMLGEEEWKTDTKRLALLKAESINAALFKHHCSTVVC